MPAHPGEALTLFWRTPDGQGQASLDPGSGEVLPSPWGRQTEGGRHFMSFHYTSPWRADGA
ncbi:hypothetical protein [Dickeya chrysanthemi]|uniref:hypothetical protein n=1 Tax=Dickeya chrysanthemi TaxID=556 RepID=UPI00333ED1BC